MKNQTKRVEDAVAASNKKSKRPRIGEQQKRLTAEEAERAKRRALLKVDASVWDIIRAAQIKSAKAEAIKYDPLSSPFKTDRDRLKHNKVAFTNMSIAQAFAAVYKDIKITDELVGNDVPAEVKVGQIIPLKIQSISKTGGVVFDSGVYKENFATRNNLAHFEKFSKFLPLEPVRARVIETSPKVTMVDLYGPMLDEFILPRAQAPWTQNLLEPSSIQTIRVKSLQLVRGGYLGQAVIPNLSEWLGEDFVVDAFIPGSQIVLNTTDDFEQYNGAEVDAFIMSYAPKPNGNGMSLVCSVKNYIKHLGNLVLMKLHEMWCDDGDDWKEWSAKEFPGIITGTINSSKKCGVFVEIPELNITGMVPVPAEELVQYKDRTAVTVKISNLEEDMVYNDAVGQYQRVIPFEKEAGALKRVNVKPILEFV